jgi:hypothetical protein
MNFGERPTPAAAFAAAVPRLAAAVVYLAIWISPLSFAPALARGFLLAMLLEFLVLHSFPFLQLVAGRTEAGKTKGRLVGLLVTLGFGAFYLIFAAAIAWATDSSTPLWTMGGLVAGRAIEIVAIGEPAAGVADERFAVWLRSLGLYFVGIFATALMPLPALGLTPEAVARLELPGSGAWIDHPQKAFAFGCFYYAAGAVLDLRKRLGPAR